MGVLHALEHVAVPAISHCFRRDAVYYWRRWTPAPKRVLLQVGLAVKDARRQGSNLAAAHAQVTAPPQAAAHPKASAKIVPIAEKLVTKQQQREKWDEKTARQARWTYFIFAKLLEEEHGVTTFSELRQSHVEHFDDFLLAIHSSFGRSGRDPGRSIAEARAIAKSKSATGLDIVTRSRHMGFLTVLFEAARASEDLDPKLNPSAFTGKGAGRVMSAQSPNPMRWRRSFAGRSLLAARASKSWMSQVH